MHTLKEKMLLWQQRLLDLSRRNQLINCRETRRSCIALVQPDLHTLFDELALKKTVLSFQRPVTRDSDASVFSLLHLMDLTGHPIDVAVGDIRTSQPYNELERTLRVLKNKARLAMDEQGQQLLYLTFGFVRWKNGSVVNNSPLLLMPVSLNSGAHSPIVTLQAADGDIVVNPTLAHLFHEKYYYQLPEFKNSTPAAYMEGLKTAFAHFGWAIIEECRLGIFSFHRMSLYRDMQEQINGIEENPILRQMYAADAFFPSMAESETPVCHVVSADDSQAEAVALSRSGRSIILLGPPGCGKSQSIINMLAQALSDGKTVLFVSKKKAALDIVHQRLKKVGLEQYVLAMHDTTKVNKQQVVKALGESLHQRVVSSVRDAGETAQQLKLLEEKLQRYPHQLHQLHQPLGMSLADAFSKIFALADLPNIQIPLGDVAGMDQAALLATMDQLANIASAQATMALWGAFKPKLDFGELGAAVEAMKAAGVPPDDYAACYPNRSLAVVAFSEAQQSQIEEQLWEERKNHPELEAFFTENKDEPFIVKNLETIQGDERDTILFSIAYGHGPDGRLRLNFGPLALPGGETRLNVAISRARMNIKVVASIMPHEIDLNRAHSEGAKALRAYLDYARCGGYDMQTEETDMTAIPFVQEVANFLASEGYAVSMNVGLSECKVDIGVYGDGDAFCAGILIDGGQNGDKISPQNDVIRRQMLERLGWNIINCWSVEFARNPAKAKAELLQRIRDVCDGVAVSPQITESSVEIQYDPEVLPEQQELILPPYTPEVAGGYRYDVYLREFYPKFTFEQAAVMHYIRQEQPIHMSLLYQRMAPHFERQRVTAVVREAVDKVVQKLLYRHIFFIEENMCMLRQKQSITPRQAGGREIEQISLQELGAVMKLILKKKGGISQEALIREATELLGYTRPGQRIEERMILALSELETMGQVELVGNEMYLKEQDDE